MSAASDERAPPVDTPVASSASRDSSTNSVEDAGTEAAPATDPAAKPPGAEVSNDPAVTASIETPAQESEASIDVKTEDDATSAKDDAGSVKDDDADAKSTSSRLTADIDDVRPPGSVRGPSETAADYLWVIFSVLPTVSHYLA